MYRKGGNIGKTKVIKQSWRKWLGQLFMMLIRGTEIPTPDSVMLALKSLRRRYLT